VWNDTSVRRVAMDRGTVPGTTVSDQSLEIGTTYTVIADNVLAHEFKTGGRSIDPSCEPERRKFSIQSRR
jgi:hypothetical protein